MMRPIKGRGGGVLSINDPAKENALNSSNK